MLVRKRLPDGTLGSQAPYVIKGVTWGPATRAPAQGPNPLDPQGTNPSIPDTVDYGFFLDWTGRVPQGHEIFAFWARQQYGQWYRTDLPLMEQMHVNTIRIYGDLGDEPTATQILDECYRRGIMVVFTVAGSKADFDSGRYLTLVNQYKSHPAILMWLLGNEWNLNHYYEENWDLAAAATATQQAAQAIHAADPSHPVSSSLSDVDFDAIPRVPAVDIWGLNVYRGTSFGDLFTRWNAVTVKPFYLSEFGIDSFHSTSYTLVPLTKEGGLGAGSVTGQEDQAEQANVDAGLWRELALQLSALDAQNACVGGFIHTFNDHLYKVGSSGLWELMDYDGPDNISRTADDDASYDDYNTEGYYLPGASPDNILNEEYFGIVDADRHPKQAYATLQAIYVALNPVAENRAPMANAGPDQTWGVGTQSTLSGCASSDPDGDSLTYAWTKLTSGVSGPVLGTSCGLSGVTGPMSPSVDIYRLTVSDGVSSASDDVTVTWVFPPTVTLTATPTTITAGQSSTLSWTSTNATSCVCTVGGWTTGGQTSGTVSVSPTATTTYGLTCSGAGGTSPEQRVTVTVNPLPPPTVTILTPAVGATVNRTLPLTLTGTATASPGARISTMWLEAWDHSTNPPRKAIQTTIAVPVNTGQVNWTASTATALNSLAPASAILQLKIFATIDLDATKIGTASIGIDTAGKVNACYVLSAAYGNPTAWQIQTLNALRLRFADRYPGAHALYLRWYDTYGPRIAQVIHDQPLLKALVRAIFTPAARVAAWWLARWGMERQNKDNRNDR